MRIHSGWSAELDNSLWRKADVDVDEDDLRRLADEHAFDISKLTTQQTFRLLEALANILLLSHVISRYANQDYLLQELGTYKASLDATVSDVKQSQGLA